ncbi:cytochrome c oxidase assembly protein [Mycolicibacterium confluentis]|nr:cytochrome c oxidase assembly protein [Mycolicibacterium confluentis]
MLLAHDSSEPAGSIGLFIAVASVLGIATIYIVLAVKRRREARGWSLWRMTACVAGSVLLILGLPPSGSGDFGNHMLGHLLIGMFAPLALVMSAPVTLILRSVTPARGRAIVAVLRSRPSRILTNPIVLLLANLGGLVALYFTPFYEVTTTNEAFHVLIHVHFFVAGYLFAWMIAGPDPGPHRPSVPARIVVLGVAVAGHAILSQLIYAGLYVHVPASPHELRAAGTLMYYWGDIAEILLALAMLLTWRSARRTVRSPSADRRIGLVGRIRYPLSGD